MRRAVGDAKHFLPREGLREVGTSRSGFHSLIGCHGVTPSSLDGSDEPIEIDDDWVSPHDYGKPHFRL